MNLPWLSNVTDAQHSEIERVAQVVLEACDLYLDSTLADLHDPVTMPAQITRAHQALDRAAGRLYREKSF